MNCVVFLLFGLKPLGKGVLLIHVFIRVNWFRCCPPRVGQLVKTTVTTAVIG